jgi:hypothetical protein
VKAVAMMPIQTQVRPKTLEDLGVERKPFYTTAEVADIMVMSDQNVLDRIHLPADDPQHLYAVALGPRTYRIPIGALAQLAGIPPRVTIGKHPRRISNAARDERAPASVKKARTR